MNKVTRTIGAALAALALSACRSPLESGQARSDVTLSFIVSGLSTASRGAVSSGDARLILPTATRLTVTLAGGQAGSQAPIVKTPELTMNSGQGAASVTFEDLRHGEYTVTAEAANAAGDVLFKQTAALTVASGDNDRALNLVPASPSDVPLLSDQSLAVSLEAGAAKAWRVPADSAMLRGYRGYMTPADASLLYFVQSLEGELLASGASTTPINTVALPTGTEFYLTFYNAGAASRTFLYSLAQVGAAGIETIWVPAGSYQRDETAANVSTVSPFYLGKHEITRAQWAAITGTVTDPGSENKPITGVSWYDAVEYCNLLSAAESLENAYTITSRTPPVGYPITSATVTLDPSKNGYRLPTESEWMWAAMGATKGKGYASGAFTTGYQKAYAGDDPSTSADDAAIGDYAWYNVNSDSVLQNIGGRLPNELGLYDMTGNAREWCQDYYSFSYPSGTSINYPGPVSGSDIVLRGGAYDAAAVNCTVADRAIRTIRSDSQSDLGFRVARNGQPLYTVKYDLNGITGVAPVDKNRYDQAMQATLSSGGSARLFGSPPLSWNETANGSGTSAALGAAVSMASGSKTLYAIWEPFKTLDLGGMTFYTTDTASRPAWYLTNTEAGHIPSLRSGPIGANQSTVVEYTLTSGMQYLTELSFNNRIQSASGVGSLTVELFVNGTLKTFPTMVTSWTGDVTWATRTENFPSGSRSVSYPLTVRWTYYKNEDDNTGAGEDAAWIDNILMSIGNQS